MRGTFPRGFELGLFPPKTCNTLINGNETEMIRSVIYSFAITVAATPAAAQINYLEGNYVTFEGCDYDKLINLNNGYAWQCSEYGYAYHYGQMTVLEVNGRTKLCIGDLEEAIEEYPNGDCYDGTLFRLP